MRWAALPITDRRWAGPLLGAALGFGLFVGVAIGPGAAGTFATGAAQIIEIPGFGGEENSEGESKVEAPPPESHSGKAGEGSAFGPMPETSSFPTPEAEVPALPEEHSASSPKPKTTPPIDNGDSEKQTLKGVVMHVNPAAGSYTLAEGGGALDVVHAPKLPRPASKVEVPARPLANGTFSEVGTRKRLGTQDRVSLDGIVTYVDATPTAPAYAVSKRGVSVLVHVHPDPADAPPALPALGALADVAVYIETPVTPSEPPPADVESESEPEEGTVTPPSCVPDPSQPTPPPIQPTAVLWQRNLSTEGAPIAYGTFAGIVTAVCPDSGQLLLSADDIRESGADLLFQLPAPGIDLMQAPVGDAVIATAMIGASGELSLTGLASDKHTRGADDASRLQGDLAEG
jgi:hypothetical protein